MATVLPGGVPSYDKNNPQGTIGQVCSYLRTLHENLDFQLGQFKKTVEGQAKDLAALQKQVQTIEGMVTDAQGAIEELQGKYTALDARVQALENRG